MFKSDVLCIGSATVDNFLSVEKDLSKIELGDKVLVKSIVKDNGGGANNTSVALKKLGLSVKILTKLGEDHDGDFINAQLRKEKIRNICRKRSKKHTDYSTIISSKKGKDRIILVHKGASTDLTINDFRKMDLKAKWIYLASLTGKSFQTAKEIIEYAEKKKIHLLFNPSLYLAKKGKNYLYKLLQASSVLILNKKEAQSLLGRKLEKISLLKGLYHLGPQLVVITNGKDKVYAYDGQTMYSLTPPDVKVTNTAGAGDAFASAFLAGIIGGYHFADCLRLGVLNSTSVIQQVGTKNGLLSAHEIAHLLKTRKIKVVEK